MTVASAAAMEHLHWSLTPEVGPVLFRRLVVRFGSAGAALGAGVHQLEQINGIGPATAERIARGRDAADLAGELALAERHQVRILCPQDESFPAPLRHIPDTPICLYVRGELEAEDAVAVGIVGARRCSTYGREQAHRFGYQLASHGLTVVSGLARGVDGAAHQGALSAGGRTLAVLGNGLAGIYPPEHAKLAEEIARHGAVISELPMSSSPQSTNFLPRNRLIAGLSLGVLVIEAARRSGSLETARLAGEYNREVFALPGRVDSELSAGANALIRDQHAKCVTCVEDVLAELGPAGESLLAASSPAASPQSDSEAKDAGAGMTAVERQILDTLGREELSLERIAELTGQGPSQIASTLIGLQLRGLARQMPGNRFVRVASSAKTGTRNDP